MGRERNTTLDLLKLLASYMVIFIHVLFYGKVGNVVDALARFAVPLFFVSSGYFSYQLPLIKIKNRILHIVRLLIFASVLHFLWSIKRFVLGVDLEGLLAYLEQIIYPQAIIRLLIFNVSITSGHLWYLWAIIYVYAVFYATTKYSVSDNFVFSASAALLLLHLFLGEFLLSVGIYVPAHIVRNFALMGIPFFGCGIFVRKYEKQISAIPNYATFAALALGIIATICSRMVFGKNELYTGSLLILFAIVIVFVKYADQQYPRLLISISDCSSYIYVFHMIIASTLMKIYGLIGMNYYASVALQMVHPLAVCFASTAFSCGINQVVRKLRTKPVCTTTE